jgi:type II secretion system protein J
MMISARERGERGFTLIEIMLALAILATLMALTWGTVSSSFRFRRATLDKFDRYRTVQQAMDRMSREISMAFVTNIGLVATNDRGDVNYVTGFFGENDTLSFTSLAHVRTRTDEAASEQCEISYRLETQRGMDGEMHQNLVHREDSTIDDEPEEGGVLYPMLRDVVRVRFEYWDPTREIAGEAWIDSWDAVNDHEGQLPSRVRITLEVIDPLIEQRTLEFSTQTEIFLQDPIEMLPPDLQAALDSAMETINEGANCHDNIDNDRDGDTDCNDLDCLDDPDCNADGSISDSFGEQNDQEDR